jgi:hypothetical protein
MEQLTATRNRLTTAVSRITNEYQTAANHLEELERSLPDLIAAIALEETDASKLDDARQEISRLRIITKEPYPQAIRIINASRNLISEQVGKIVSEQAAIDRERTFRELFNHCLETHSRSANDWELLKNSASHYHLRDVDQLDRIHYEYDNARHLFQPDYSPTFIEYAASKGLPLYNLDVTIDTITQPKA